MSSNSELFLVGFKAAALAKAEAEDLVDTEMTFASDIGTSLYGRFCDAFNSDSEMIRVIADMEDRAGADIPDDVISKIMDSGTGFDMVRALRRYQKTTASKTAAVDQAQAKQRRHQAYIQNKPMIMARSKAYRMAHLHQLRRKSKSYRRKVKRKIVRPKKRIGTASSGYTLIPR